MGPIASKGCLAVSGWDRSADSVTRDDKKLRAQAHELLHQEIAFVHHASFLHCGDNRTDNLAPGVPGGTPTATANPPPGAASHLARLCSSEILTAEQEKQLFTRMNFLKFRAARLRSRIDSECPDPESVKMALQCLEQARAARDRLIQCNTRLVISIVRKMVTPQSSFDDLFSDGVMALMYAVEKFDCHRGFRFSTYAYRAISRTLYRAVMARRRELSQLAPLSLGYETDPVDRSPSLLMDQEEQRRRALMAKWVKRLDSRERLIIRARFALGRDGKKLTLRDLGERLGISKERVRQLEKRALARIMTMAADAEPVET